MSGEGYLRSIKSATVRLDWMFKLPLPLLKAAYETGARVAFFVE